MSYNEEFQKVLKVLKKYREGRDLDMEDEPVVRELCNVGMMKTGISLRRQVITAKTIGIGRKLL
jgi:hypothetical protein